MRIVMIGHKYVPSREGGIEVVVDKLATRMAKKNNEVTLFNRKRKKYSRIDEYEGCKVKEVFTINKKSLDAIIYAFFATLKARKLIKKGKVDVVHFHAEGPCYFLNLLPKKGKRNNAKVIVTIHGLDWQRNKWGGFASKILKSGEKKAVKYADEIIVLSHDNVKYFEDVYKKKTVYIPNGSESPILHEPEIIKQKYNLDKDDYVLFLARIVAEKGLHYLIEAWKKIKPEIKNNKKLVIAGGPSHSEEYFNKIMDSIKDDDSIIATGFVKDQELYELYTNAYLYVLPSDLEGMAMSLLEAISYGNTCLVSNIEQNTEVINDPRYTFIKGDVEDLKKKLEFLLQSKPEGPTVPRIHNWDEVVDETLDLYKGKLPDGN